MIPMQQSFNREVIDKMTYLVGNTDTAMNLPFVPAKEPFDDEIVEFLNSVSKLLMKDSRNRTYSDVVTLGFWLRKASIVKMKEQYGFSNDDIHLGRGVAFHIAPSNVPVNFAYSLVSGLLMGNSNIVRVPSKDFEQVDIIAEAFNRSLEVFGHIRPYIVLVRYERSKEINDALSSITDTRIIWGGNETIKEIRKSALPPQSTEITFADRYSIAVIDADLYLVTENKVEIAQDFYNDTYFSDQNACTSPKMVVWLGKKKKEAKKLFWNELHQLVKQKYTFQSMMGINKLASSYLIAAEEPGTKIERHTDNWIIRVNVPIITDHLMDLKDNCGYFFEYDCDNVMDLRPLVDDRRCQTIGLLGDREVLTPLIKLGIKGIDRVVPIGKTMDFELIWDGYDLPAMLTRCIR